MLTFEREYFERPVYGPDTQCVMDLMAGKITISEVPFAYRGKREFNCAFQYTKSLPHAQAEIERELIRKQMLDDIAECRRRGKRGGKGDKKSLIHQADSPPKFLSLFESPAAVTIWQRCFFA